MLSQKLYDYEKPTNKAYIYGVKFQVYYTNCFRINYNI